MKATLQNEIVYSTTSVPYLVPRNQKTSLCVKKSRLSRRLFLAATVVLSIFLLPLLFLNKVLLRLWLPQTLIPLQYTARLF